MSYALLCSCRISLTGTRWADALVGLFWVEERDDLDDLLAAYTSHGVLETGGAGGQGAEVFFLAFFWGCGSTVADPEIQVILIY